MSENKNSQEKTLKQNEKIENHTNNHEIPKNEAENQKCFHQESLRENDEIDKINNLQEQFEDEVDDKSNDYNADEDDDDDDDEEEEEYVEADLSKLTDLNCPICDGVIKQTKTIKECLHRFCKECIDVYVSNGNKECPVCFTDFLDERSILDDKAYDTLIAAVYPDMKNVKKETPIVEESNKGPRIVAHERGADEEPIVEKSDDDTASTQQSNKDRPTKK